MSNFSQFLRGTVSVGEYIWLPVQNTEFFTYTTNPTIDGAEYLRCGSLKSYTANYSSLMISSKRLGILTSNLDGNASWNLGGTGSGANTNTAIVLVSNANAYFCLLGTTANYTIRTGAVANVNVTTTTVANVDTSGLLFSNYLYDAIVFKGNVIAVGYSTPDFQIKYIASATSALGYTFGGGVAFAPFVLATANDQYAITIAGQVASGSGFIATSVSPATWTARTPNAAGESKTYARAAWCKVANNFVFVTTGGAILTAPDGYTFTSRTAPTGIPTSITWDYGNSQYNASSNTCTLIGLTANTLLRMTSNTDYSLVRLDEYIPFTGSYVPKLLYKEDEERFYMYVFNPRGVIWTSDDDGLTWDHHYLITRPNSFTVPYIQGMSYANGIIHVVQNATPSIFATSTFNRLNNAAPDYVGHLNAYVPLAISSEFVCYLRIA